MNTRISIRSAAVAASIAAATLAGCVTTAPIKDMISDRETFLNTQFTPAKLRPEVKAVVDKHAVKTASFKSMRLSFRLATDDDGRKRDVEGTAIILNAGGGLFQRQDELSSNGFPYRVNNTLDFLGVRSLIWQSGFHNRANAEMGYEVKQLKRLDAGLATAKMGDELIYEGATGSTQQVVNYLPFRVVCKVGDTVPASTLNAGFEGQGVKLTCTRTDDNGTLSSKANYLYLKAYGVALATDYASSRVRDEFTYDKVDVRR